MCWAKRKSSACCARALASSVLPTPVGPRKMKEPMGRLGSCKPALALREFVASQEEGDKALYSYALDIEKGGALEGHSIKDSGIRENYDCMVLGLQRENLPLAQPDINMVMQSGDLVWILGTSSMADKVLKE